MIRKIISTSAVTAGAPRQLLQLHGAVARGSRWNTARARAVALCIAASVIGAAACAATPSSPAGTHFTYPRLLSLGADSTLTIEAGELFVAENRAKPAGRAISIAYYRLRSTAARPATPIFILAGGPGVAALDEFELDPAERAMALFYRGIADVVIFDQRGAGRSRPAIDCPQRMALPLDRPLTHAAYVNELRQKVTACRNDWLSAKVDLAAYNTLENAADADALRRALGYDRISIVAGSYGSHLAFALLREYPQQIERALLYGIEGPDHTYDMPSQTVAALTRVAAAAEQDKSLQSSIPPGGLMAAFTTVLDRAANTPVTATGEHDGKAFTLTLGKYDLQRLARDGVHNRTDVTWAANVIAMYHGDFSQAAEGALYVRNEPVDSAMYFMMDCASGISAQRRARLLSDPGETRAQEIIGDINLDYLHACDLWNSSDLGTRFRSDLRTAAPILIFQGTWDISTPLENAQDVVRTLTNGKLVTVEGGTHWTLGDLFETWPGTQRLLSEFLQGRPVEPPQRITLPAATFRAPAAPGAR